MAEERDWWAKADIIAKIVSALLTDEFEFTVCSSSFLLQKFSRGWQDQIFKQCILRVDIRVYLIEIQRFCLKTIAYELPDQNF